MPRGGKRENAGRPKTGRKPDIWVTISEKAEARLTEMAKKAGTSKSAIVESAILGDSMTAQVSNPLVEFKQKIKAIDTEELKTLRFIVDSFAEVLPAHLRNEMEQKSIIADTMWFQVQREFDARKVRYCLEYTLGEMYFNLGIPKEFLS